MLKISNILKKQITKVVIFILLIVALGVTIQTFWSTAKLNSEVKSRIVTVMLNRTINEIDVLLSQNPNIQKLATILLTPEDFEVENLNKKMPAFIQFMNATPGIDAFSAKLDDSIYLFINTETNNYVKLVEDDKSSCWTIKDNKIHKVNLSDIREDNLFNFFVQSILTQTVDTATWTYYQVSDSSSNIPYLISSTQWGNAYTNEQYGLISIYINANELMNYFEERTAQSDEEMFFINNKKLIPNIFSDSIEKEIFAHIESNDKPTFNIKDDDKIIWGAVKQYDANGLDFMIGLVIPETSFSILMQETRSFILSYSMLSLALILIIILVVSIYMISNNENKNPDTMSEKEILDIIESGESDNVEFKSTIRWNLKANKAGKEIEFAWLKTVAAFLNTTGGFIFIGINDDGKLLGLENDKFQNEDKFLLHFNNLIKTHIGLEHANLIHIAIRTINEQSVFIIKCEESNVPVFIKHNGLEDFYVRLGPASRELAVSETIKYLQDKNNN